MNRPMASMNVDRVGYDTSDTGLVIAISDVG